MHSITFHSPFDEITIFEVDDQIVAIEAGRVADNNPSNLLIKAKKQLQEYFIGKRTEFDLPIAPANTKFQQKVFDEMNKILYGKTKTYGEIAKIINSSPRAVAQACKKNPTPIIVPCHRVVSKTDTIGGYSGFYGVESKKFLLNLEA